MYRNFSIHFLSTASSKLPSSFSLISFNSNAASLTCENIDCDEPTKKGGSKIAISSFSDMAFFRLIIRQISSTRSGIGSVFIFFNTFVHLLNNYIGKFTRSVHYF